MVYRRLESLETLGVKLGLENIRTLLAALGNPQSTFPSILIAGTNGKGSVGAMLAEILRQQGLRTGHYISPHLVDVRERIRIDNEWIPSTEFESGLATLFSNVDRLLSSGSLKHQPTYFETLTALAFLHFALKRVDWAVVEVGMGGRFDATNVLEQQLSIITTIDYDHEAHLGPTLTEIAGEKVAILKTGGVLVSGELPAEAEPVIAKAVANQGAVWHRAVEIRDVKLENGFPVFEYRPWNEKIRVNLRGRHQAKNAATALLACDVLQDLGVPTDHEKAKAALAKVQWRGRLEMLSEDPPVLIDSAHNPQGVRSIAAYLQDRNWPRVVVLFTSMQDKKYEGMIHVLSGRIETIFLTRVEPFNRCATSDQLIAAAQTAGLQHQMVDDPLEAFVLAKQEATQKRLPLVVFGSMYLIGVLLKDQA